MILIFGIHYPKIQELFKYVSIHGVIAGGSVVFHLNHDLLMLPEDIDVFVNSPSTFYQIYKYIKTNHITTAITTAFNVDYHNTAIDTDNKTFNLLNFHFQHYPFKIQMIYQSFSTPYDVINSFDLDYVRCAYHHGLIYQNVRKHMRQERFDGVAIFHPRSND